MLPESVYWFIEPHIRGYTDKQREELIKLIEKDINKPKPRPMTQKEKDEHERRESLKNYFRRAQERNRRKREGQ